MWGYWFFPRDLLLVILSSVFSTCGVMVAHPGRKNLSNGCGNVMKNGI
jgi:hypothetical protein